MPGSDQSRESFGEFVAAALPALLRFGHVLTGDPRAAEDLVQEALARTLRRWRAVRQDNALAYVRKVMVNTHINRPAPRARRRRSSSNAGAASSSTAPPRGSRSGNPQLSQARR